MAVIQEEIKLKIRELIDSTRNDEETEKAVEDFCQGLSLIITDAIKSATVSAAPGTIVTSGTATTQVNTSLITFQID